MPSHPPTLELRHRWRRYLAARDDAGERTSAYRVGITASFTAEPLTPYLGAHLLTSADIQPEIHHAGFNTVIQTCLDPESAFGLTPSAIVVLWRIEDLYPRLQEPGVLGKSPLLSELLEMLGELTAALQALREHFAGTIVVSVPPFPSGVWMSPAGLADCAELGHVHRSVVAELLERLAQIERIRTLDLDTLQRYHGVAASEDRRKWYLYRQPYKEEMWECIGAAVTRILVVNQRAARKCVVLDCDNTLWGGVVGEEGLAGIALADDFPGSSYRDFQSELKGLKQSGIMLALASKNNAADVWEVFDRHDAMILRREDISSARIDWNDKASNLRAIAGELNIGLDALVFVDDSDFEVAQVHELLPEVTVVKVPEELSELPGLLTRLDLFERSQLSAEDRNRTRMMAEERDRNEVRDALTAQDFLDNLRLKVSVSDAEPAHLGRITQLVNKTNQFNLTTIRRSPDEVDDLNRRDDYQILMMRVEDRFGDYGLTGVAIVQHENKSWTLDTLLMSCRVLGRGVESAFLAAIAQAAGASGAASIIGRYVPTEKNALAANFFSAHGFQATPDGGWSARPEAVASCPSHIQLG